MRYGHLVHLTAFISTSALGGPTGNMTIGNIPYSVITATNYVSPCAIGAFGGWTGPVGFTSVGAQMPSNANYISLHTSGSGQYQQASQASEWDAASTITVSCTYVPAT
jgi:hypothetical protein